MQPISRKELEALVDDVRTKWYRGELSDVPLNQAITDAIWEKMVPIHDGYIGVTHEGVVIVGDTPKHTGIRALICTDTPAPTREEDAVKLAREAVEVKRLVDAMTIPVSIIRDSIRAGGLCGAVDALARTADRILKEADDGQV